jgi:hypothetical protein
MVFDKKKIYSHCCKFTLYLKYFIPSVTRVNEYNSYWMINFWKSIRTLESFQKKDRLKLLVAEETTANCKMVARESLNIANTLGSMQ